MKPSGFSPMIKIALPTNKDLEATTRIHFNSLPNDILPSLGLSFLHGVHETISKCEVADFLIAKDGENVAGFCIVSHDNPTVNGLISKDKMGLIRAIMLSSIRRPLLAVDIFGSIISVEKHNEGDPSLEDHDDASEIFIMAVNERYRGHGVGKALVSRALECVRQSGHNRLVTKTSLADAAAFYKHIGFSQTGTQNRFVRKLSILSKSADLAEQAC